MLRCRSQHSRGKNFAMLSCSRSIIHSTSSGNRKNPNLIHPRQFSRVSFQRQRLLLSPNIAFLITMMAATMRIRHISGFFINNPTITRASVASANNQSIYSSLERLTKSKINPYRSFSSSKRKNSISDESDQAYFSSSDNPNMEDPNGPKPNERPYAMQFTDSAISDSITYQPIGIANTPFLERHGVPRQPLTEGDRGETSGSITLLPSSPHLEGKVDVARNMLKDLDSFSHVVVLAHLHLNTGWNAQVVPPRLRHLDKEQGKKGLFATRAPHRPNSIGMSVLKIKSVDIEDYTIHFYHVCVDVFLYIFSFGAMYSSFSCISVSQL
mmetsp:Transcript_21434/g.31838  ORF Transcript_21434/g.31838 Transcript_21434/m.31838 type:complete len:326 (+) Transcript_21434:33-1010(+)